MEGSACLFRPMYAEAYMGHPFAFREYLIDQSSRDSLTTHSAVLSGCG
jgi:hypothetical protein